MSADFDELPILMSPKYLAEVLGVTTLTLQRWRDARKGPAWHAIDGSNVIRYSRGDVAEWLDATRMP